MNIKFSVTMHSLLHGLITGLLMGLMPQAQAEDAFWTALTGGKPDFSVRLRYENVDDDTQPRDANANTARVTLGYRTGRFHGVGFYGEVEHVQEMFSDNFSHPARPQPGFPVIADPEGTEINQAYLFFDGIADTSIRLGRQEITYRDAPFHRFIGTILWRQNWQTFDAASVVNTSLPDTILSYAYVWNVNRIFGDDAPDPLDDFDSNSHFINAKYNGFSMVKFEAYAYLFEFDNAEQFSTNTYGTRANGGIPVNETIKAIYTAEYAHQNDAGDNVNQISADYLLGELGAKFSFNGPVTSLLLKASYELLEGKGGADTFNTILGTNHAFQGWADRFLITPGDGIEDIHFTAIVDAFGAKFIAVYHDLSSDNNSYEYGTELDLLATKTFYEHYTFGLKYSDYDADQNAFNSGATAADVSKFWAFVEFRF